MYSFRCSFPCTYLPILPYHQPADGWRDCCSMLSGSWWFSAQVNIEARRGRTVKQMGSFPVLLLMHQTFVPCLSTYLHRTLTMENHIHLPREMLFPLDQQSGGKDQSTATGELVTLIGSVTDRMASQSDTGYISWPAATILARWIVRNR